MLKNYIVRKLRFTPSSSDADMYYQKNKQPNGGYYSELLLVNVDNVVVFSHDPNLIMEMIGMRFEIKNDKWGPLTRYLGADVSLFTLPDGKSICGCSGTDG
jgi:hypothetical protein